MKHLYPLIILLFITSCAHSQDSLQSALGRDSSIRETLVQGPKYPCLVYSANGEVVGRREIVSRLELYSEPAEELQRFRNSRGGVFAWAGVSLASAIGAAVAKSQNSNGVAYTCAGLFLGALIAEFTAAAQAERHLKKAIHIYNKRFVVP